jgi:hypothetical protein
MPDKYALDANNLKNQTSIANPRDFKITTGVDRFNPVKPPGGGPAVRQAGHRLGQAPVPGVARMNPKVPQGGGPAIRKGGHRVGQVEEVNPQTRFHPPLP